MRRVGRDRRRPGGSGGRIGAGVEGGFRRAAHSGEEVLRKSHPVEIAVYFVVVGLRGAGVDGGGPRAGRLGAPVPAGELKTRREGGIARLVWFAGSKKEESQKKSRCVSPDKKRRGVATHDPRSYPAAAETRRSS